MVMGSFDVGFSSAGPATSASGVSFCGVSALSPVGTGGELLLDLANALFGHLVGRIDLERAHELRHGAAHIALVAQLLALMRVDCRSVELQPLV